MLRWQICHLAVYTRWRQALRRLPYVVRSDKQETHDKLPRWDESLERIEVLVTGLVAGYVHK